MALHAGRLPGYPASYGCIRVPYDFARLLYAETKTGITVVVSDDEQFPVTVAHPGLVAPVDEAGASVAAAAPGPDLVWQPEAAPEGPVTILVTEQDRSIRVFRAGVEIGRAPFVLGDPTVEVTLHVLTLLEPSDADPVSPTTSRRVPRWLVISGDQRAETSTERLLDARGELARHVGDRVLPRLEAGGGTEGDDYVISVVCSGRIFTITRCSPSRAHG